MTLGKATRPEDFQGQHAVCIGFGLAPSYIQSASFLATPTWGWLETSRFGLCTSKGPFIKSPCGREVVESWNFAGN